MNAERMPWTVGPSLPPRPDRTPEWWRTFPQEFATLEHAQLGHWEGDRFYITPPASEPITYRYIGEFGEGEALMQLIQVVEE